ncbi:WD40 repeat-like protein, partial [Colletotrichum eremochloae]
LQIYDSALLFSPEKSVVRKHFFKEHAPKWITVVPGVDTAWDMRLQSLYGHESSILTVVYSPDGQWLLSGSYDGTVKLWQANSGNCKWSKKVEVAGLWSVAFSSDSQSFTAGSLNGIIKVWNMENNQVKTFRGHEESAEATKMAISKDGGTYAYALRNTMIHIWSMNTEIPSQTFEHDGDLASLSFTADGQWLASVSTAGTVNIWDTLTGNGMEVRKVHRANFSSMAISKDHQQLASASGRGEIVIWEIKTGAHIRTLDMEASVLLSLVFRDSFQLAWGGQGTIKILNISDGTTAQTLQLTENEYVDIMEFSKDGRWLAYTSCTLGRAPYRSLKIWDTASEQCCSLSAEESFSIHTYSLDFSLDNQQLVSTSRNGVYFWDVPTGHCIRRLKMQGGWEMKASLDAGIKGRVNTPLSFLAIEIQNQAT